MKFGLVVLTKQNRIRNYQRTDILLNRATEKTMNSDHSVVDTMLRRESLSVEKEDHQQQSASMEDSSIGATNTAVTDSDVSYADYTPPTAATNNIAPPAKYKLFLLVLVMIYFAVWVTELAGLVPFLRFHGWLGPDAALFLSLCINVFVLTYATLDLVVVCTTYKHPTTGKLYGLGAWLKAPRKSPYWSARSNNFFVDVLAGVLSVLEDGFEMFHAPEEIEQKQSCRPKSFTCADGTTACAKTLKIEHYVDPNKIEEYKAWHHKMARAAKRYAHELIQTKGTPLDETDDYGIDASTNATTTTTDRDIERGETTATATTSKEGVLSSIYLTFSNIYSLNEWMTSPERSAVMEELQPLLVVPDVVQIRLDRELPDAFTDLLTRQGQSVPKAPPQKWKVGVMTVSALYLSKDWIDRFLPYYHDQWGTTDRHDRLQAFVTIFVTVFSNSYVTTPLLLFLFHPWVQRKETTCKNNNDGSNREPWRTLNDGFGSIWWKVFWTFALYGGSLIAWAVKKHGYV